MKLNSNYDRGFDMRSSEPEEVELPQFQDIAHYATGKNVLPQRFYIAPARQTLPDLTLKVKDQLLQVEGAVLPKARPWNWPSQQTLLVAVLHLKAPSC